MSGCKCLIKSFLKFHQKWLTAVFCLSLTLLFILCFVPVSLLSAENAPVFSAEVRLYPESITIDERFNVALTLHYPPTHRPETLLLTQHLLGTDKMTDQPFSLVSQEVIPATASPQANSLTSTFIYTLEPWQEGSLPVSFRYIRFLPMDPAKDKVVDIWTPLLTVQVDAAKKKDGKFIFTWLLLPSPGTPFLELNPTLRQKMMEVSEHQQNNAIFAQRPFPWGIFLSVGVLLIVAWLMRGLLRRLIHKWLSQVVKPVDYQREALKKLQELEAQQLPRARLFEKYYILLTAIVREYIENRYEVKAPEHTTEEFLQETSTHPLLGQATRERLALFLEKADLVKFARYSTSEEECTEAFKAASNFIEQHYIKSL